MLLLNVLRPDAALTRDVGERQYSHIRTSHVADEAAWSWHRRLRNNFIALLGPMF